MKEAKHSAWDEVRVAFHLVCMGCGLIIDRYAILDHSGEFNYCPNCGAKMDGEE